MFFVTLNSFAQDVENQRKNDSYWFYSPFSKQNARNTYSIKCKALPYTLGNGLGINNSLGFEIGFFKNNSIGTDFFYNYSRNSHDFVKDKQGVEHESGNRSYSNEKAVQFNYRYYLSFKKMRNKFGKAFYSGLFYRIENSKEIRDENFKNEFIEQSNNIKAYGVAIGIASKFKNSLHFGMDYNIQIGHQLKDISTLKELNETSFERKSTSYFNVGISLNYWF